MYYYFSAGFPAAIKINGAFLGVTTNEIKFCQIDELGALIEVCSLTNLEPSVNFILDDKFLSSPPYNVSLTDLGGGYLINCKCTFKGGEFKLLDQVKNDYSAVSVFIDNGLKVSIETASDFFAEEIPLRTNNVKIEYLTISSRPCALIFFECELSNYIAVYSLDNKIIKQLFLEVLSYDISNGLSTAEQKTDIAKHLITTDWKLDGSLSPATRTLHVQEGFCPQNLPNATLPYAFLEQLLVGGDILEYISENIKGNAEKLKGFLGDFIGVMPPPIFKDINQVGLIYKKEKNKYKVEYFTFEIVDGRINNIDKI